MSDDALRLAERALAASPDDAALVDRVIAERRRAGLVVGEDLLDRRVLPARRLAFGVPRPFVTAVAPDGEEAELLGADDAGVDLAAHRSWQGELWLDDATVDACALEELAVARCERVRLNGEGPSAALASLDRLPLTHCELVGPSTFVESVLGALARAPHLIGLAVESDDPVEALLDRLPGLHRLAVSSTDPAAPLLRRVGALRDLRALSVDTTAGDGWRERVPAEALLDALGGLPDLRELELWTGALELGRDDWSALADAVPGLTRLELRTSAGGARDGVAALARLPLERLSVHDLDDEALRRLAHLPLRALACRGSGVTPAGLAHLPATLARLEVQSPLADVSRLARLSELRELHLRAPVRGGVALAPLAPLRRLSRLDLQLDQPPGRPPASFAPLDLAPLGASRVRDLSLRGPIRLDAASARALGAVLETLFVYEGDLPDDALSALASAHPPRLRTLALWDSPTLTDDGLRAVAAIESLEWIYVNRCPRVTRAGADDLARALPGCSVTLDDDEVPAPT